MSGRFSDKYRFCTFSEVKTHQKFFDDARLSYPESSPLQISMRALIENISAGHGGGIVELAHRGGVVAVAIGRG